jgi:Ribonuclease G/E
MAENARPTGIGQGYRVPAQDSGATSAPVHAFAAPPALLYQELSLAQRVLRDFVNPEPPASSSIRARTSSA